MQAVLIAQSLWVKVENALYLSDGWWCSFCGIARRKKPEDRTFQSFMLESDIT
jgi:hypothetical protein